MEPLPTIDPPSPLRTIGFWLAALLLGMVLLVLFKLFSNGPADGALGIGTLLTCYAAVLSLAALPFLLLLMPWALGTDTLWLRWLRIFTLQSGSLGLINSLAHLIAGNDKFASLDLIWSVGTFYFLGGLLAAYWCYAAWLQPHQLPA